MTLVLRTSSPVPVESGGKLHSPSPPPFMEGKGKISSLWLKGRCEKIVKWVKK